MIIIQKLIYIWQKNGLSQESIAKELDVSFATVNRWIHRRHRPLYRNCTKINTLYISCLHNLIRAEIDQKIYFALHR